MNEVLYRYDFHIHTHHSNDSFLSPRSVVSWALRRGLHGIAVTDHDTIRGGLAVAAIAPPNLHVIVGAEIATSEGDIIGLFLSREIRSRDALEVIDEIEAQGGIAVLPHPHRGHRGIRESVVSRVSAYEVLNGRAGEFVAAPTDVDGVRTPWAPLVGRTRIACSDAHIGWEIGRVYTSIAGLPSEKSVREALGAGRTIPEGKRAPSITFILSQLIKMFKTRDVGMIWRFARKRLKSMVSLKKT